LKVERFSGVFYLNDDLLAISILAGTLLTKKSIFLDFTIKTQEFFSKASSLYFPNSVWDKKSSLYFPNSVWDKNQIENFV
jgi:hypothetical protein